MPSYREIPPSAPLLSFVESCWILEDHKGKPVPQRVVPDGHPELILNLGAPFEAFQEGAWRGQPRCFLAGQIQGPLLLRPAGPARILGFRFHPYGAAALFGPCMQECGGRFTTVDDLSSTMAWDLDRALNSRDPLTAVQRALTPRHHDPLLPEAVRRISQARGNSDLAILARDLGLSTRQFERRFQNGIGLTPKVFCRIQRFLEVLRVLESQTGNWVDTALACGYYDQAHLIRDFKSFSGEPPSILLSADADLARHFLLRFGVSHSYKTASAVEG